jgi:hemoglobin
MAAAIGEQDFPPEVDALLLGYVGRATPTLINQLPDEVRVLPDRDLR